MKVVLSVELEITNISDGVSDAQLYSALPKKGAAHA